MHVFVALLHEVGYFFFLFRFRIAATYEKKAGVGTERGAWRHILFGSQAGQIRSSIPKKGFSIEGITCRVNSYAKETRPDASTGKGEEPDAKVDS